MMTLTEMPKYDAYKDSGVEWPSEIPVHWQPLANKYIFRIKKQLVGKESSLYNLLSLTLRGVIKRDMENPEGKFPAEFDTYQEVNTGDFVFCLFDVEETPRTVGLSELSGMITGAYTVFEVKKEYDKKFIYYFYLNLDQGKRLKPLYKGLRNTIPKDAFMAFKTFIPSRLEQYAIANFLDAKTAQIDEAIAIKEQQIALLNERKQILIQQAVTQGIDPTVPMKDSGVAWIGKIPEHWEIKALKYIVRMKSGETIKPEKFTDIGFPVYGGNGFRGFTSNYTNDGLYVLIGRQGALCGNVNYASGRFYASEHAIVAYPIDNEVTIWLGEVIRASNLNRYSQSAAQPGISVNVIKNILFPYPPNEEQKEIASYAESIEREHKKAVCLYQGQIEKLKEYKITLINSAVTGKIKVV